MRFLQLTPVSAASAAARSVAETVAALRSDGHEVDVVGLDEHWPEARADGFEAAIPWRERHRIEPLVPQADMVFVEVAAETNASQGAAIWIPFTRGVVSVDDLGRHPEAMLGALSAADTLVLHSGGEAPTAPDALLRPGLPPVVGGAAVGGTAVGDAAGVDRGASAGLGSRLVVGTLGGPELLDDIVAAVASAPDLRAAVAVSIAPSATRTAIFAHDLDVVTAPSDGRVDVGLVAFDPATPWAESAAEVAAWLREGVAVAMIGGPDRALLPPATVAAATREPLGPKGLRAAIRAAVADVSRPPAAVSAGRGAGAPRQPQPGETSAPALMAPGFLTPAEHARRLVALAGEAAAARPLRQLDAAFAALRAGRPPVAARYAADTAPFRPRP